jgi:hypothetical protein
MLLSTPVHQDVLEEVISLSGFEHLIEVVPLVYIYNIMDFKYQWQGWDGKISKIAK